MNEGVCISVCNTVLREGHQGGKMSDSGNVTSYDKIIDYLMITLEQMEYRVLRGNVCSAVLHIQRHRMLRNITDSDAMRALQHRCISNINADACMCVCKRYLGRTLLICEDVRQTQCNMTLQNEL